MLFYCLSEKQIRYIFSQHQIHVPELEVSSPHDIYLQNQQVGITDYRKLKTSKDEVASSDMKSILTF